MNKQILINCKLIVIFLKDQKFYPMSSEISQVLAKNTEDDQITAHKAGNTAISDIKFTKEEVQAKRHNRMV